MGRPKGSRNKPKEKVIRTDSSVVRVKMEKQLEAAPRVNDSNRGWINFGNRNDYPQQLSDLYWQSPTHKACVDFAASAILGGGVDIKSMKEKGIEELMPNYQQTWDDLIHCLALDYTIYGSYAMQICKNKDGKTYSVFHQPVSDVRCGKLDEDGVITRYYVSSDWSNLAKFPPVEFEAFNFTDEEEISQNEVKLFVYRSYSPDVTYYQLPRYIGALRAIQAEIELIRFDLRSITNNFNASGVLSLQQVDDEDERKRVLDSIEAMFNGSDNASSLMVTFRNNATQDDAVTFTPFDKSVSNVNLFQDNNDRTIERIIASHRIPSKGLIGYPTETASLGGDGNILNIAFNLYNKLVGDADRKAVVDTINKVFSINGVDVQIKMKPWYFGVLDGTVSQRTDTTDVQDEVYDADNAAEKVVSSNE